MDVALGEAFVNVRADLKPFARDVERGVRDILRTVERRLTADGEFGRAIGESVRKQTSDGISEGLEDGFDRGARRGTRKALTGFQKFFASLGDFADDGLSALPSEVKAALVLGVVGAAAAIAPLLAGTISAAITAGAGIAIAGIGIALAARFRVVQDQFVAVGRNLIDELTRSSRFFIRPLIEAGSDIDEVFAGLGDRIDRIFSQAALSVKPLTAALTGFITQLLPGIQVAVEKARPLIETLAKALPQLGADIGEAFAILADGSAEASVALSDIIDAIGTLIIFTASLVRALSDLYFWLRVTANIMSGDTEAAAVMLAGRMNDARTASGQLTDAQGPLDMALGRTAAEAEAARLAISGLVTEQLRGVNATIDYEAAIDNLQKSIKEGNKDFRETTENGRQNLQFVQQAIIAAGQRRDAEIAVALQNGQTTDTIEANYRRQIDAIEGAIGKNRAQGAALKEMFDIARSGPDKVSIEVTTPGLAAATQNWKNFAAAVRAGIRSMIAGAQSVGVGTGMQTAVQKYANGGIVSQPTLGVVGEAGYKEAVIPDPAVMPDRAMELSNKFGLTSMIADALGAGKTIVNVFIGQQRLEEIADYRIGLNNTYQAQSLAYGPRP
jgi:hypothetical protein